MKGVDKQVRSGTDPKSPRPMPTDPKDLTRAMFRGVERKIEARKLGEKKRVQGRSRT